MAKIHDLNSSLFDVKYPVVVRIVMSHDVVHRKNKGFAAIALENSGFSKFIVEILPLISESCRIQILGESAKNIKTVEEFRKIFPTTNCRHYVNMHDDKMCTVEFTCKFESTVEEMCSMPEAVLDTMHLEIKTPVGDVQL